MVDPCARTELDGGSSQGWKIPSLSVLAKFKVMYLSIFLHFLFNVTKKIAHLYVKDKSDIWYKVQHV